jgi:hypothetical protein
MCVTRWERASDQLYIKKKWGFNFASGCTGCVAAAVADEGVLGAISAWWQRCAWVATGPKGARWDP